jgi:hypothetical protein
MPLIQTTRVPRHRTNSAPGARPTIWEPLQYSYELAGKALVKRTSRPDILEPNITTVQ